MDPMEEFLADQRYDDCIAMRYDEDKGKDMVPEGFSDKWTFLYRRRDVCYRPEGSEETFTAEDFFAATDDDPVMAERLFDACQRSPYESPEKEWASMSGDGSIIYCENCGRWHDQDDEEVTGVCPHCKGV